MLAKKDLRLSSRLLVRKKGASCHHERATHPRTLIYIHTPTHSDKHTRTHTHTRTQNQLLSSLSENIAPKKKKGQREGEQK